MSDLVFYEIIRNEFCIMSFSISTNTIWLKWLPDNRHMSQWEFIEQTDALFSSIAFFKVTTLYIDAFDFCYPINNRYIQQLGKQIKMCKLKQVGIVISSDLLGQFHIKELIKTISIFKISITMFNTREDGEYWVSGNNKY